MSVIGTKRKSRLTINMSAKWSKADISNLLAPMSTIDQSARGVSHRRPNAITHEEALANLRVRGQPARAQVDLQDVTEDLAA